MRGSTKCQVLDWRGPCRWPLVVGGDGFTTGDTCNRITIDAQSHRAISVQGWTVATGVNKL